MANSNQSRKRARQAESRRKHNAGRRSLLRTSIKKVLKAISAGEKEDATSALQTAMPIVDKMAGKKIIHNQVIQFRLSELKTEVELLRSLIYRACEHFIQGEDVTLLASMAKLKSGRLIREVADTCVQYYGGMGFTWENQASRLYLSLIHI